MDNRSKIILTDTDEDARGMLQEALEHTGRFSVVGSTGDGSEALRMIQELKPDLLVLDMILPGMDGLGILRRLGSANRPKILAMSNFIKQEVVMDAGALGASMFISKPYDQNALVENLIRLGERKEEPSVTKSSSSSIFTSFASRWPLGRFVFCTFLPLSSLPMS